MIPIPSHPSNGTVLEKESKVISKITIMVPVHVR